jgi:hypothetical protein
VWACCACCAHSAHSSIGAHLLLLLLLLLLLPLRLLPLPLVLLQVSWRSSAQHTQVWAAAVAHHTCKRACEARCAVALSTRCCSCCPCTAGHFYDVAELDAAVAAKNAATGWELSIHVDAASGGARGRGLRVCAH